jgi:hypothetical protein
MINEWVAFLDTLDNPQGAHEGLAHTLELIEMRWYHSIKICPFFHIVAAKYEEQLLHGMPRLLHRSL